jgi:hypothetical protein
MPAEIPQDELSRAIAHEPDASYPDLVEIRLIWNVNGQQRIRTQEISAAEFFGRGRFGAPLPAESLISAIERMRRQGVPDAKPRKAKR